MNLYIFKGKELRALRLDYKAAIPREGERIETIHPVTGIPGSDRVVSVKWVFAPGTTSCTIELGD